MKNKAAVPVLLSICMFCFCSKDYPNRNNPSVSDLPEIPFTIRVREMVRGFHSDSLYTLLPSPCEGSDEFFYSRGEGPDGREFRFEAQRSPLVVTPENGIVLISSAPVNASSGTDAVDVERINGENSMSYRLVFRHEGKSTIKFWNGNGNAFSLNVLSRSRIPLEDIVMIVDGKTYPMRRQSGYAFNRSYSLTRIPFTFPEGGKDDPGKGCLLELQCVPFNATGNGNTLEICYDFGQLTVSPDGGGTYSWNVANYPHFRWFNPNGSITVPPSFYQMLLPADLLGRKIWIWNSGASIELGFKKSDEPLFWGGSIQTYLFPF